MSTAAASSSPARSRTSTTWRETGPAGARALLVTLALGCGSESLAALGADASESVDGRSPAGFRPTDASPTPGAESDADDATSVALGDDVTGGDASGSEGDTGHSGSGDSIEAGEGAAPAAPTGVTLTPEDPGLTTLLTCASTAGVDPDGGETTTVTRWFVSSYENVGSSGTELTAQALVAGPGKPAKAGDTVFCRQWASDGQNLSAPVDSNVVTLRNSPPTSGGVLVTPVDVTEGGVVTCVPGGVEDVDGDVVSWTWGWLVNDVLVPGQTSGSLTSDFFDKGDAVRCVASPTDGTDVGEATPSKNAAIVGNSAPSITIATVLPLTAPVSGTFTCTWGGWSDADPSDTPGAAIEWQVASGGTWAVIASQTSSSLSASSVGVGAVVRCVVTPTDGTTSGASVTSNTASVVGGGPSCTELNQPISLAVKEVPPSVLLVVDRSGSMYEAWPKTKAAVGDVLAGLGEGSEAGLLMYPSGSSCSIGDGPQVPFGPTNAVAIEAAMQAAGVGGSTPMGKAMKQARIYLEAAATPNTTVILAADGKPSDTCLEDCTGCDCTDEATCLWCADLIDCTQNEVRKEVVLLESLGVRTFVIGYEGGFGATAFLESLAEAGGTANIGETPFFDAGDGSQLAAVLEEITGDLSLCTASMTLPQGYTSVTVSVGGTPIAEDTTGTNGWTLTTDGQLRLHGAACDAAKAPGTLVDVHVGCP